MLRSTEGKSFRKFFADFALGIVKGNSYSPPMPKSADAMRRWFGLLLLALAFALLIWGQTVLRDRLSGAAFLFYWGICFLCTIASIVVALLDVRATRKRAREEHERLMKHTLDDVEKKSDKKDD